MPRPRHTKVGKLLARGWRARTMGKAWLRHGIEEMANFENLLPQLYQREATS